MIKIYKLKTIVIVLLVITLIAGFILILKDNSKFQSIQTASNNSSSTYKIIPIGTKVTIIDGVYGVFGKGLRELKSGMYGSDVMEIQKKLKELGFFNRNSKWKIWSRNRKGYTKILQS